MAAEVTIAEAEMQKNRLWFSNASLNGLFSMDTETFEIRFEAFFPGEDLDKRLIHRWVFSYCDKLYFIPFTGQAIHIFDGENITVIPAEKKNKNPYYLFSAAAFSKIEKRIYLITMDTKPDLLYLDLQSNCIYSIPSFRQYFLKLDSNADVECQITNAYIVGNELRFLYGYKWFMKWNTKQGFMDLYEIAPNPENMVFSFLINKNKSYFYFKNGDLAVLDEMDNSKLDIRFNTELGKEQSLVCVCEQAGYIWFISGQSQILFKCKDSGEIVERLYLEKLLQKSNITQGYTEFVGIKYIRGNLCIFNPAIKGIIKIENDGSIEQVLSNFCSDDIKNLYYEYFFGHKERIVMEGNIGLPDFLKFICHRDLY